MNKVVVLNPIGRSTVKSFELAARLKDYHGKKIGFIDNMKPNAGPFLERVGELLLYHLFWSGCVEEKTTGPSGGGTTI